jgi:hypothetical protein
MDNLELFSDRQPSQAVQVDSFWHGQGLAQETRICPILLSQGLNSQCLVTF